MPDPDQAAGNRPMTGQPVRAVALDYGGAISADMIDHLP